MALSEYILQTAEESVVLSGEAVRCLIQSGNGDAALAYIALTHNRGRVDCAALGWPEERLSRAVHALMRMGLIRSQEGVVPQIAEKEEIETSHSRPEYTRADLAAALEGKEFSALTSAVENVLGKRLTTPDLSMLLGLYDDIGLGADVIFLLVNFCLERSAEQYGPGRRPTMRQIEREGYAWARMGLMDQDRASAYIKKVSRQRETLPRMMKLLGLGERKASASEERYMIAWSEMGFEDAVIERAYDKTVLKCKELKWPYMNKILQNWHEKGLHTIKAVEDGDRPAVRRPVQPDTAGQRREEMALMQKYLREMREENNGKGEA